ncbi:MAG: right-handed parallel beta-helix repeat-containing protein [Clostridiales bacterium]|nr:right-handed parallel beta-helix repeat-containing protein [Clostridiales bacterium]
MKTFFAKDHGVLPGADVTRSLAALLRTVCETPGEKTLVLEPGTYRFNASDCETHRLVITNSVSPKEFAPDETPHINAVPFYLSDVKDLTVECNGAIFEITGKVTNFAAEDCENLTIKDLEFRHTEPDMHEFLVLGSSGNSATFVIDAGSRFEVTDGKMIFFVGDERVPADKKADRAYWIGLIRPETPEKIERAGHPLKGANHIERIDEHTVRVTYNGSVPFCPGERCYVFDVRRQFAGIFLNRCKNVTLSGVCQRFNYGLALALQCCDTAMISSCVFAPEKCSPRKMASVADFIQACMCRGQLTFTNNLFDGAGDDCLNVHGVHLIITNVEENRLTVRFMHPQTFGYNPIRQGDELAFIDPKTLLETGKTTVQASEMQNDHELLLTVSDAAGAAVGRAVEDVSACPDVTFADNEMTRIITRGLLLTTRGKVTVENNRFISTTMSGVLCSDDANNWYESGMCADVTVKNNIFESVGAPPVLILPENSAYAGPVHRNIRIENNRFLNYPEGPCVFAKSTDDLAVSGNVCAHAPVLETENCTDVKEENNKVL